MIVMYSQSSTCSSLCDQVWKDSLLVIDIGIEGLVLVQQSSLENHEVPIPIRVIAFDWKWFVIVQKMMWNSVWWFLMAVEHHLNVRKTSEDLKMISFWRSYFETGPFSRGFRTIDMAVRWGPGFQLVHCLAHPSPGDQSPGGFVGADAGLHGAHQQRQSCQAVDNGAGIARRLGADSPDLSRCFRFGLPKTIIWHGKVLGPSMKLIHYIHFTVKWSCK